MPTLDEVRAINPRWRESLMTLWHVVEFQKPKAEDRKHARRKTDRTPD